MNNTSPIESFRLLESSVVTSKYCVCCLCVFFLWKYSLSWKLIYRVSHFFFSLPLLCSPPFLSLLSLLSPSPSSLPHPSTRWFFNVNDRHRLLSYICVLALISSSFTITQDEVDLLTKDLQTKVTSVQAYFREVGAKFSGRGKERKIVLKAPLKLPVLKARGRRG